jgi:uncharacterized membrane protein
MPEVISGKVKSDFFFIIEFCYLVNQNKKLYQAEISRKVLCINCGSKQIELNVQIFEVLQIV